MNNYWIEEAKKHFLEHGKKAYMSGDDASKKSQELNEYFQQILDEKLANDNEIVLNKQGSKWSIQGQNILADGIWYRSYHKSFGNKYPIVFGTYIGKNGFNIAIQIYNNVLGDISLSEKLGIIISKSVEEHNLESQARDNENEKYFDWGFFGLDNFDEEKFDKVLKIYKSIVYKVNQVILEKVIEEFNEFLKNPSDITHLNLDGNGQFYQNKLSIVDHFDAFLKNPTYKNLEWWDKSINSANMQGNRTNLIKKIEGLTLEEVKSLKDDSEILKIKETFEKIRTLVDDEEVSIDFLEKGISEIDGMNATARELAYYIQMQKDKIPLVNGMTTDVIKHIEKTTELLKVSEPLQNKIDEIKSKIIIPSSVKLPAYYVIDQFFNLLHKISLKDVHTNQRDLYLYAYLFANLFGKAESKGVEKDDFIETIKKGLNIIYYGAPGTGKTFSVKNNIENIVDDIDEQFVMTQFHPSYSYEDFIEGVKPVGLKSGVMSFELKDGEFKLFCEKAKEREANFLQEKDFAKAVSKFGYFFFVDEINRAELSRVFGELLYSLEYRGANGKIKTQYSSLRADGGYFYIPKNLFFIGTMNDVDRSIDSFDLALRRRFIWIRKDCDYQVLSNEIIDENIDNFKDICKKLNDYVVKIDGLGEKYQIGHSYFLKVTNYTKQKITQNSLNELFDYHIEPLLTEYLRVDYNDSDILKHLNEARKLFKLAN